MSPCRALLSGLAGVVLLVGCGSSEGTTTGAAASASASSAASSGAGGSGGAPGAGGSGGAAPVDADGDGIDDATEAKLAADYLPYLSVDPKDGCALGGILYRVTPHPAGGGLVWILYDHLFQDDCGLGGHVGDDEAFGETVDPTKPAPDGILSLKAIGHQNTACEQVSECGSCSPLTACDVKDKGGKSFPIVYSSKDKHASYALASKCASFTTCFDSCSTNDTPDAPPMVNAGEPDAHLVTDLTDQAFITAANGWTKPELMHFDPWDPATDFGGAGNIAGDLVDTSFVPSCP